MNEQERAEFERLKRRLESLQHEFDLLWMQTQQLEARLQRAEPASTPTVHEAKPLEIAPLPVPPLDAPIAGQVPATSPEPAVTAATVELPQPPPIPPIITPPPILAATETEGQVFAQQQISSETAGSGMEAAPQFATEPSKDSSFEMRLGTYWLVRIGIVMVLTAMVFLGNLAYQKYYAKLGPPGKVILLYLASGLLLGVGGWFQRKQESLRNYGQVLFAGGLAAVYFTTYAAHHIENLQVIHSGLLDGLLLLAWAGFMTWLADRRKSELLALFGVGLAYYTSIITNVGLFTLYSNLVLTAAGVFFFVRNRWAALSFASLFATYGGYTFWRFYVEGHWVWRLSLSNADFQLGNLFLLGYWLLFTAAVFLSRHGKFAGEPRAAFLTVNNAAFFCLVLLARLFVHTGSFWKLSLSFGAVLIGLAALAARRLASERIVVNSYLTQGLVLVTLGVMSYFTGLKLALVLAAESVILLILADQRKNLILRVAGYLVAALSVGWAVFGMKQFDRPDLYLGAAVGVLMLFNAWWSRHYEGESEEENLVRPSAVFFSTLALLTWIVTTWNNTTRESLPLVLAVEAVVFTVSIYALRVPEISMLGQLYLILAQFLWLFDEFQAHSPRPWWNPALLVAITLGLSHWWQWQKRLTFEDQGRRFLQGLYSLALVGLLYCWLHPLVAAPTWLALSSVMAVGLTIYGLVTRAWLLAACGQLFLGVSGWEFIRQLWEGKPEWYLALAPMAALGLLALGALQWFERKPDSAQEAREPILGLALLYRWAALLMSLAWVNEYIPASERIWVLAAAGALIFWWSGWQQKQEGLAFSAVLTAAGLGMFWVPLHGGPVVYLPNLFAIFLLLGQQRLARRLPEHFNFESGWQTTMIIAGTMSLWRYVSKWVMDLQQEGIYLTASWAMLALLLFVAGLLLSERMYRWIGLAVLGCALGRVVIFDVWKLETLYRILSFMALGIVLLVLGFIYNKYQEKIKEWL